MKKMQCQIAANCDVVSCPSKIPHDEADDCLETCTWHKHSTCMPVYQETDIKIIVADILTTALEKLNNVGIHPVTVDAGKWEEHYHALRARMNPEIEDKEKKREKVKIEIKRAKGAAAVFYVQCAKITDYDWLSRELTGTTENSYHGIFGFNRPNSGFVPRPRPDHCDGKISFGRLRERVLVKIEEIDYVNDGLKEIAEKLRRNIKAVDAAFVQIHSTENFVFYI